MDRDESRRGCRGVGGKGIGRIRGGENVCGHWCLGGNPGPTRNPVGRRRREPSGSGTVTRGVRDEKGLPYPQYPPFVMLPIGQRRRLAGGCAGSEARCHGTRAGRRAQNPPGTGSSGSWVSYLITPSLTRSEWLRLFADSTVAFPLCGACVTNPSTMRPPPPPTYRYRTPLCAACGADSPCL